jgi:hypothetical protein
MKHLHAHALMMAVLTATALLCTSCGSSSTTTNRLVPQAQAEADLKRALDAGIISRDEYEEEIEKLRDAD